MHASRNEQENLMDSVNWNTTGQQKKYFRMVKNKGQKAKKMALQRPKNLSNIIKMHNIICK